MNQNSKFLIVFYFLITYNLRAFNCDLTQNNDRFRNAMQIITSRGFIAEEHSVITSDGFILGIFRIINPFIKSKNLKPILLSHGILVSCNDYLLNAMGFLNTSNGHYIEDRYGKSIAYRELNGETVPVGGTLAFVLSQFKFDVWLGNWRTNNYSSNHTFLTPKDRLYWAFSIDELIKYDLPAMIHYIKNYTKKETIGYIGHSLSNTAMFGLLSTRTEYNHIINPFIALSPVVFVSHNKGWKLFSMLSPILREIYGSLLPRSDLLLRAQSNFCQLSNFQNFCSFIIGLITGHNQEQWDFSRLGVLSSYTPDVLPSRLLAHLLQFGRRALFNKFDFGLKKNLEIYGQNYPPEYPLTRITAKIALFYSFNDKFINEIDISLLKSKLKVPLLLDYIIPEPKWSHIDYFLSKDVGFYVNSKVIDILRSSDWSDL